MSSFAPTLQKSFPSRACEKNYSMKRITFTYMLGIALSVLFLFQSTETRATHIMGGDLTYTCLGGNTYMMQLRLFRDCNGISLGNQATINLSSPTCGNQNITLNLLAGYPIVITPLCPNEPDVCINGFGTYGVHEYVYKGPVTLSGCWANASDITISWSSCCRNNAITTLSPPGATYISTDLDASLSPCNNSPDFLNSPIAFFCVNEAVNYNHGAADPDGDSLSFSLVNCRANVGTSNAYVNPYSGTNPLSTASGITIDPATGGLQFTPNATQVGVVCVLVEEYRNGVKIGEVVRDMQFTIITCINDLPIASGMDGTATLTGTTGSYNTTVCAGDTVQFTVSSYDKNISNTILIQGPQNVTMGWNQAISGASFTIAPTNPPTGTFFWVPDNSHVGNNIFTVDVADDGCPVNGVNIYSYLITVLERPEMDAGNYQVTCSPGDTVTLNATYTSTTSQSGAFVWSPPHGIADTASAMTNTGPDSTMTYTANVTYSNGCTYVDSVIIEVTDGITLPDFNDTTICQGGVQLDATIQTSSTGGLFFRNDSLKAIPDDDSSGVYSYINVSGVSPAALNATTVDTVCVTINHFWDADLDIYLISPDGIIMELSTDNGGGNANYTNACFSPSATTSITAGTAPFTGTFLPEGSFSVFNGSASNGTWRLWIVDDGTFFTGSLAEWSIKFADPNQVTYSWAPPTNLSCTNCPDPLATPANTTTYTVTATNQNGCTDTSAITITVNDTIPAPVIQCAGITPNSLVFCWDTLDGVTGYEVNIDNTGWVTPNGPGTNCHSVTGLSVTQTVNIQVRGITTCAAATVLIGTQNCTTAPCTLAGSLGGTTNVSCNGGNDGAVTVTASGGTPGYQFSINGGASFQPSGSFGGLIAGNYTVHVIDSFLCQDSVLFTITEPAAISLTMAADSVNCYNGNDGTATVTATGGTGAYTYAWSGVTGNIPNITALTAGTYIVTVTDANNCVAIDSVVVGEPDTLALTTLAFDVSCNGAADGSVTVTATGGNGGNSYAWSAPAVSTTNVASSLSGGIYTVTVTDFNGCTTVATDTVNENSAVVLTTDSIPALCNTSTDGAAIVVATGGTGTYTYLWDAAAGNQVTDTAFNVGSGTYTVTVTDSDGCSQTITATVTAPSAMGVTMSSTPALCHNSADGSTTVVATGGTGSYTYAWNTNPTQVTATATGLLAGFHTVTVTDGNGCTIVDSVQVNGPTPISITLTPAAVTCFGNADGAITSAVTGGAGGYTYAWSNTTATTPNLTNISGGTYILTVTDANGCSDTASTFVPEPISLVISLDSVDVSCFNGSDGQAQVTVNGGTMPYVYLWTPSNQSTPIASNIPAGWHTVSVTDANGCAAVDSIFVNQPATGVTTSMSMTPLNCNGDGSGTATVTAVGGSGNYTYSWNTTPVQNTPTATGLQAGTYTATVSDVNGCTYVDSITVTEPTPVTATTGMVPASCNGYADGAAVVTPSGGVGGFTYAWSTTPVQTDSLATNLAAGTYTVTVTDANGCFIIESVTVTEPTGMTLTMSMNPVSCHSGNDGDATVGVTGGTSPYVYNWSSGALTPTAPTLTAGWHYVTVTDANGCFKVDSIEVTEPDTLTVNLGASAVSCFGGSDGQANAFPSGGVGPYTYAWNTTPVQTTQSATNIPTGTYTVTVTDANGCIATGSVFVDQPASGVSTTTSMTPVNCNGGNDGTATVVAVGGAGNYTYQWSNTQTGATATGLTAGSYTVTVTDQNGCFVTDNITVDEPSAITLIVGQTSTSCFGGSDGTATVVGSGGVPNVNGGYTYLWNSTPVQNTATATGLNGGQTYTVTVTDENGCVETSSITISQPSAVQLTTVQTNVTCNGFSDATATVTPSGGTPGYTFQWDANAGSQTTALATNLPVGIFEVTVTDFNNCSEEISVNITEPLPLAVTSMVEDVVCKGEATGSAQILAAGGTPWYSFQWDANAGSQTNNVIDGLAAGSYTVTMTDANGCEITETISVAEPAEALLATNNPTDVSCFGDRDGQIEINATGGAIPYQYSLDGNNYSNSSALVGLTADEYIVYVRDDVGCVFTDTVVINEPAEIIVNAGPDLLVEYGSGVSIVVQVQNGQIPYLYNWLPADSTAGLSCDNCPVPIASPLQDVYYQVQVTDANGCIGYDEVAVRIQKVREVYVATGFTPNNDGINDFLFVQGGDQTTRVVEFNVYDRWGEKVYTVTDSELNEPTLGWDGRFKGQIMNSGVYGWTAVVEFVDGERIVYKGNTTLIR
jgi:gliding motility-associated-like protein